MDQDADRVIEVYRDRLQSLGIIPEKIIVFGSYAQGVAREDSDLDLLVIASAFEKMDLWERMSLLGRARSGIMRPMEILGISPSEIESLDADSFIKEEVLEKGVVVG